MILFTILISLAIQRLTNIGGWIADPLLETYLKKVKNFLLKLNGYVALTAAVIPILVLLGLLHLLSLGRLLGIAHLGLMILVLLFSVDMKSLNNVLSGYFAAMKKHETHKAINAISEFVQEPIGKKTQTLPRLVTKSIFKHEFTSIFAPLFWFMVLNIYGVVIYCLVASIRKIALKTDTSLTELAKAAVRTQDILDWIPLRLVALSYSLAGQFLAGFNYCYKQMLSKSTDIGEFAVNTGLVALGIDMHSDTKGDLQENHSALSLIDRALSIWVIALALFTLGKLFT